MANETRFEWDPRKSESNRRKHGFDFVAVLSVFRDPFKKRDIEGDVDGEIRWRTIGEINRVIFVISHTIREEKSGDDEIEIIRIVSARRASRRERQEYEEAP